MNKKALYELIMRSVSREVKRVLNEDRSRCYIVFYRQTRDKKRHLDAWIGPYTQGGAAVNYGKVTKAFTNKYAKFLKPGEDIISTLKNEDDIAAEMWSGVEDVLKGAISYNDLRESRKLLENNKNEIIDFDMFYEALALYGELDDEDIFNIIEDTLFDTDGHKIYSIYANLGKLYYTFITTNGIFEKEFYLRDLTDEQIKEIYDFLQYMNS